MRKILLFLLLFSSSSLAQPAKVLICAPGNLKAAQATDTTLQKFYHEKIDISDTLTDAINNYDAVFLLLSRYEVNLSEQFLLLNYLKSNKNLYLEDYVHSFVFDYDSNVFWKFVGIDRIISDLMMRGVQHVIGKSGTFTEGFVVANSTYNRLDLVLGGGLHVEGRVIPVLTTIDQNNPSGIHIAHKYETDSFKVVFHEPVIPDYYNAFLGRVICNYFGLCEPLKVEPTDQTAQASFSVFPNPAHEKFRILSNVPYSSQNTLELFSSTGSLVSTYSLGSDQIDIDLSGKNLSAGTYFLRMLTEKGSLTQPIYLRSK